jgi:outer membrane biosynthesis protein TonB
VRKSVIFLLAGALALWAFAIAVPLVAAGQDKVTICHASGLAGTTKFETLTIAYPAVYGPAGHFYENGTPQAGHEEDYLGPCNEPQPSVEPSASPSEPPATPTPSPTVEPSASPSLAPSPSPTPVVPGEPSLAPSPTPDSRVLPPTDMGPGDGVTVATGFFLIFCFAFAFSAIFLNRKHD